MYMYVNFLETALIDYSTNVYTHTGWLCLVGSIKLWVSFEKEPYKRDSILYITGDCSNRSCVYTYGVAMVSRIV